MRCPGVIKIGLNDYVHVMRILVRGHMVCEIIKIRFTNCWNFSNGGIGLIGINRKIIDNRNIEKVSNGPINLRPRRAEGGNGP